MTTDEAAPGQGAGRYCAFPLLVPGREPGTTRTITCDLPEQHEGPHEATNWDPVGIDWSQV